MLLTFGAAVNKADNALGNTPLHFACLTGNTCAAKLLLDAKAEINVSNHKVSPSAKNIYLLLDYF